MSTTCEAPSFWRRVALILRADLARDRGWWLGWLLLLAVRAMDHWDPTRPPRLGTALDSIIAMAGLALVIKLIRADAPASDNTASLTRPLGRNALWMAKLTAVILVLWTPFLMMHALSWRGYSLGLASWAGALLLTGLPALTAAFAAAWMASIRLSKGALLATGCLAVLALVFSDLSKADPFLAHSLPSLSASIPFADSPAAGLLRCRLALGISAALLAFGIGWSRAARARGSLLIVTALLAAGTAAASAWSWDWQRKPVPRYRDAELTLHPATTPAPGVQTLWPGLHLAGLPVNHVAAVVALAPEMPGRQSWPPRGSFSDFTQIEKDGQIELWQRWMKVDHAQRLSALFPGDTIWIGDADPSRMALRGIVNKESARNPNAAAQMWRLRLLIHEWKPRTVGPLRLPASQRIQVPLAGGRRLELIDPVLYPGRLELRGHQLQKLPRMRPGSVAAAFRIQGEEPSLNVLMTVRAPMLDEVIAVSNRFSYNTWPSSFWVNQRNDYVRFDIPLPVIHMDLTGLDLARWMETAEAVIWLPEERGVIDLEISPEELARALQFPAPEAPED